MSFHSVHEMLAEAEKADKALWEVILENDLRERDSRREDSLAQMARLWREMKSAANRYEDNLHSASGMAGGDGALVQKAASAGKTIGGNFIGRVIAQAIRMGESNACMKKIVAAPTAGSCGVLPAVLIPYSEDHGTDDGEIVRALYVASGFGQIIADRAFIAGAEGGCQAEIGTASAMAAAALVYLHGGTAEQSAYALAFALENLLGLVCDPVAGLVEVPCIKRNVVGAVNAVSCADMALAGMKSVIPPDEVIDAMRRVGESMPEALRETGKGGLAATPEGVKIKKSLLH
ncbi:MAG: L-serine ammonia-lyase, iron-sulfur-dependent, subunit alpha [Oscillospiraceae bacterium]